MGSIVFGSGGSGKVKKETQKMYRLARKITGYASGDSYGSSSGPSVGSMRDYVMDQNGRLESLTFTDVDELNVDKFGLSVLTP